MKKILFSLSLVAALVAYNCTSIDPAFPNDGKVRFDVGGALVSANVSTKAAVVTADDLTTSGFKVNAVKGTPGEDVQVWSNILFTKEATYWEADKWWPVSSEGYRFFGCYPGSYTMTYAAGGPTIAASNAHDIVCAYASAPTFREPNTLNFEHIFARVKNVTVTAVSPYTISNMSIMLTPKVSGTYNLYTGAGQTDGTGWSATSEGSEVNIATAAFSEGVSTTANDIYLVPGTYTLSATWTATKDNYTQTFTAINVDVALVGGKTNNIIASLTGSATEIQFGVSVNPWDYDSPAFVIDKESWKKPKAVISVNGPSGITEGKSLTLTINAGHLDYSGSVIVTIKGVSHSAPFINGKAKVTIAGLKAGKYSAHCQYPGDEKYSESDIVVFSFIVKKSGPIS